MINYMLPGKDEQPSGTEYFEKLVEDHVDEAIALGDAIVRYMRDELGDTYHLDGARFQPPQSSSLPENFSRAYREAWNALQYLQKQEKLDIVYQGGKPVIMPDSEGLIERTPDEDLSDTEVLPAWQDLLTVDEPDTVDEPFGEGPFDRHLERDGELWEESNPERREEQDRKYRSREAAEATVGERSETTRF